MIDYTPKPVPAAGQAKKSRTIAKIWPERCTGCEACIAVAPWDTCIRKAEQDQNKPFGMIVCEIQTDVCTGCTLCMKICPWDAITMVPRPAAEAPKA
jgi:Pyruvate/2-oxoacid:ferredoxin oxidoreductase delta subunit